MISWMCINLYSRNAKPVVWLWKLMLILYQCVNVNWDASKKTIDTFATFFLLSYAKFVFASLRTLTYYGITFILNVNLSLHQTLYETGSKYEVLWKRASSICHYLSIHLLTFSTSYTSAFRPLPHWTCQGNIFKCPIGSRTITVDSQSRL